MLECKGFFHKKSDADDVVVVQYFVPDECRRRPEAMITLPPVERLALHGWILSKTIDVCPGGHS